MAPSIVGQNQILQLYRAVLAMLIAGAVTGCATVYKPPVQVAGVSNGSITGTLDEKTDSKKPVRVFVFKVDGVPVATAKSSRCDYDKRRVIAPGQHVISVGFSVGTSWTQGLVGYTDIPLTFSASSDYLVKGAFKQDKTGSVWVEQVTDGKVIAGKIDIELVDHPQRNIPIGFAAMVDSCAIP